VIRLSRSLTRYHILRGLIKVGLVILVLIILVAVWDTWPMVVFKNTSCRSPLLQRLLLRLLQPPRDPDTNSHRDPDTNRHPDAAANTPPHSRDCSARNLARSGCYEGYNAFSRIPQDGGLRFLPSERRFDQFIANAFW